MMPKESVSSKVVIFLMYFTLYVVLYVYYVLVIYPSFEYSGLSYEQSVSRTILGVLLTLALAIFLPTRFNKPSDIFLHLHMVFPIVPMLVLYSTRNEKLSFVWVVVAAFGLLVVITRLVSIPNFRFNRVPLNKALPVLTLLSLSIVLLIVASVGPANINFDFEEVYEFRSKAENALPGVFAYLSPWAAKILIPICLIMGMILRRKSYICLSLIMSILMFAYTQHKTTLLMPAFVLFMFYFLQMRSPAKSLLVFIILIVSVSVVLSTLGFSSSWIDMFNTYIGRRVIFMPGQLNYEYYEFFSLNEHVHWADSKLTFGTVESSYDESIPRVIGYYSFGVSDMNANTGWIGSGYAHAGAFGVILYSVILSLILTILDSLSRNTTPQFVGAIGLPLIFAIFTSTDLTTSLLTHGLLILLILLNLIKFDVPGVRAARGNNQSQVYKAPQRGF